jgi:hypothetical protein
LNDGEVVGNRHGNGVGKPCQCVSDTFGLGGPDPGAKAAIMFKGGADVPSVDAMRSPCLATIGLFMDNNMDAGGGKGGRVEIELAVDLGPGR